MRDIPSPAGQLVVQLGSGQVVTILSGPSEAAGFTWWQVEDRQGRTGWIADGDGQSEWLSPQIGEPQPVNRPPRVGDRVTVTTQEGQQLTVRALPGTDAPLITRVNSGQQFTVLAGPQSANGYVWYQIRSDDGLVEGWSADGDGTTRWLSPFE
jgi:uncharacterized protein YgiM (DUF1202 family)